PEKYAKKIRIAQRLSDYDGVISSLFEEQNLVEGAGFANFKK
ncbi:MAG: diguanylate cyclase, partial [Niameybacter sp.]